MNLNRCFKIFSAVFYNLIFSVLFIIGLIPLWAWCLLKKHSILPRLGGFRVPFFSCSPVWFHAASMGEINVIDATVRQIRAEYPQCPIVITTTSETGQAKIKQTYPEGVFSCLLPVDFFPCIALMVFRLRPACIVIVETELWPNLCYSLDMAQVPRILINARISDKSHTFYRLTAWFWKSCLRDFHLVLARSRVDAQRFLELGVEPSVLHVLPHIKNGSLLKRISHTNRPLAEIEQWCPAIPLVVFGSIREKEESDIINTIEKLLSDYQKIKIILAPRHMSRLPNIRIRLEQIKLPYQLKTGIPSGMVPDSSVRIIILDTMGELIPAYQSAVLGFVGGTLADYGGHNILEPVLMQVPVLFGPYIANCPQEAEIILQNQAGIQVQDQTELLKTIRRLVSEPEPLRRMKSNTMVVNQHLQQVNAQVWSYLQPFIPPPIQ
ncbi:MAG: hypothetical protein KBA26_01600 [Candidatus Delongbacteria bacterium]|nr:hypothetical protein [Candidatus Delongbacteria bacterium]